MLPQNLAVTPVNMRIAYAVYASILEWRNISQGGRLARVGGNTGSVALPPFNPIPERLSILFRDATLQGIQVVAVPLHHLPPVAQVFRLVVDPLQPLRVGQHRLRPVSRPAVLG